MKSRKRAKNVDKITVFWNVVLAVYLLMVSCLLCSSTLKMEAVRSFEMSVKLYYTTQHDVPEDSNFHSHCCEKLN